MLSSEIIRRVREIQVRTGRQVADVLAGEYVSVFRGTGIEFDEVRPYIPGDDVRSIDWNVTARTGEPFVKRYVEERQLTIMLVADVSASLDYGSGTRSKRDITAEFCALLAFSAIHNDDNVGLVLFHGEVEQYIPPRKGQKHALRVVREVLAHESDGHDNGNTQSARRSKSMSGAAQATAGAASRDSRPSGVRIAAKLRQALSLRGLFSGRKRLRAPREATSIANAMQFLLGVSKRKSVCFVVSDFLDGGLRASTVDGQSQTRCGGRPNHRSQRARTTRYGSGSSQRR